MDEGIKTEAQTVGVTAEVPAPAGMVVPWSAAAVFLVWLVGELCVVFVAGLILAAERALGRTPSLPVWQGLWASILVLPLRLLIAILTVKGTSETRLADIGLTGRCFLFDVLMGIALACPVALIVYLIQFGCEALVHQLPGEAAQEHPFSKLAKGGLTADQWAALILAATVAAPLWEELLFRGLVQPWAMTRRWAGSALMAAALLLAALARVPRVDIHAAPVTWLVTLSPVLAVLALVPVFLVLDVRRWQIAGLFAAAVLFGWVHVAVWPSPVALTVLGVVLGWLRWRTNSLTAPIVLHAVFNAIAAGMLLVQVKV